MTPFFIDLHTHLRGTLSPRLVKQLSHKNNIHVPDALIEGDSFAFSNFTEFLNAYDKLGAVVRTANDLAMITSNYLVQCAHEGTRYVELMLSPVHSVQNGIPLKDQLDAVEHGIGLANQRTGIQSCLIATAVRHQGPEVATALAEEIAELQHPVVRGFGLTGNERVLHARDFAAAFYIARSVGLGCTAHVGEWGDAASVIEAVHELGLDRVGHGLSVATDPRILDQFASRGTALEICLSSNRRLKGIPVGSHPLRVLFDAGCAITLATDDPAFFSTTPKHEYELAKRELGFSDDELKKISVAAIDAAFCTEIVKSELRNCFNAFT